MVVQKKQRKPGEVSWPKVVLKKWLNLRSKDSEFNADEEDEEEEGSDVDEQDENVEGGAPYKLRRRNSETLRAQYIDTKELRICIGAWNAAGRVPPEDLDIGEWLGAGGEPADIYVLGFQEVVPLNAGNVFGAEDGRPALAWEDLIRGALRQKKPARTRYKCYSYPPSPSRFDPVDGTAAAAAAELLPGTDTDTDTDPNTEDETLFSSPEEPEQHVAVVATPRRMNHFTTAMENSENDRYEQQQRTLLKTLSMSERVGLAWPEQPLDLLSKHTMASTTTSAEAAFKSSRSFRAYKSLRASRVADDPGDDLAMIPDHDLDIDLAAATRKKQSRSPFVRIVSKQMVGIFLTVWVRRGLRKCVHNVKVSTVGVGAMGYIGNKGSVSVSMSIYQTMFCFVCSHLAAGEKSGDLHKRNADVQEIHRRTHFTGPGDTGMPKDIYGHERIFWLGDLNYRIDVAYDTAHELISTMDWAQLAEKDQSAEARAEEGPSVRRVDGRRAGVRADVQIRAQLRQVHRRRPARRQKNSGMVRQDPVVRKGREAGEVRQGGADAVRPPAGGGDLRGGGGGVLQPEAAEGADADGRRGGGRQRRAGPRRFLTVTRRPCAS